MSIRGRPFAPPEPISVRWQLQVGSNCDYVCPVWVIGCRARTDGERATRDCRLRPALMAGHGVLAEERRAVRSRSFMLYGHERVSIQRSCRGCYTPCTSRRPHRITLPIVRAARSNASGADVCVREGPDVPVLGLAGSATPRQSPDAPLVRGGLRMRFALGVRPGWEFVRVLDRHCSHLGCCDCVARRQWLRAGPSLAKHVD